MAWVYDWVLGSSRSVRTRAISGAVIYPLCDIIDHPIKPFDQVFSRDGTAWHYFPAVGLDGRQV